MLIASIANDGNTYSTEMHQVFLEKNLNNKIKKKFSRSMIINIRRIKKSFNKKSCNHQK